MITQIGVPEDCLLEMSSLGVAVGWVDVRGVVFSEVDSGISIVELLPVVDDADVEETNVPVVLDVIGLVVFPSAITGSELSQFANKSPIEYQTLSKRLCITA